MSIIVSFRSDYDAALARARIQPRLVCGGKVGAHEHALEQRQVHAARHGREVLRHEVERTIAEAYCWAVGVRFVPVLCQLLNEPLELLGLARRCVGGQRPACCQALIPSYFVQPRLGAASLDRFRENTGDARVTARRSGVAALEFGATV